MSRQKVKKKNSKENDRLPQVRVHLENSVGYLDGPGPRRLYNLFGWSQLIIIS